MPQPISALPHLTLLPPTPDIQPAIETLLDAAFGVDRFSKRSYGFRKGRPCVESLSRVAWNGNQLVGTLQYWDVDIENSVGARQPALLLGPLGVSPDQQGTGVGRALIADTLIHAAHLGHQIVLLVGPMHYYGRFGFQPAQPLKITMPGEAPERLLVRALVPDVLEGVAGKVLPGRCSQPRNTLPNGDIVTEQ